MLNNTILATAINRTLNESVSCNSHISLGGQGQRFYIFKVCGFIILRLSWFSFISSFSKPLFFVVWLNSIGIACYIFIRQDSLTSTEDVTIEGRHRHVIGADFNIVFDRDVAITTGRTAFVCQCIRHTISTNAISSYWSYLATAIDTVSNLSIALNSDSTLTTC